MALLSGGVDALVTECAHFPAEALLKKLDAVRPAKALVVHVNPESRYDELKALAPQFPQLTVLYPNDRDNYRVSCTGAVFRSGFS